MPAAPIDFSQLRPTFTSEPMPKWSPEAEAQFWALFEKKPIEPTYEPIPRTVLVAFFGEERGGAFHANPESIPSDLRIALEDVAAALPVILRHQR